MFTDVSVHRELHPGFEQSSFINGRDRILLHRVEENVPLKRHRHMHAQFGYNFWGSYEFIVEDVAFNVRPGSRYLLDGLTHHSACAITQYYSMDYKFISNNGLSSRASFDPIGIRSDVHGNKVDIELEYFYFDLMDNRVSRAVRILPINSGQVTLQFDKTKVNLAVTSESIELLANNRHSMLEAMHIYKFDPAADLTLQFGDMKSEMIIISI